jgi:soluble lytic murein transglycosylase-like protein
VQLNHVEYNKCFVLAGLHYSIPPNLLYVIANVESKMNPYALNVNKNGSYDIGIMQVNSAWLPKLAKIGVSHKDLIDGCKNIQVGAWILSQSIKQYGLTTEAIGRYNSSDSYYKSQYVNKIFKEYNRQQQKNILLSKN